MASSSYKVQQGNIFGRIGSGIGQGLAEQVPKEIERNRLASGLQQFEKESANLSLMQQLARLSAIPGITPQMIQSFGELGKQQARGQALIQAGKGQEKIGPGFVNKSQAIPGQENKVPSITQAKPLEEIQKGYIPPTLEEKEAFAADLFEKSPQRFGNDPDKAREASEQHFNQLEKIDKAQLNKHANLTHLQDNVIERLSKHAGALGVKIPPDAYSIIEDKAIQATKPKGEGGEGLTEQQAMKTYGKELDNASRDYETMNTVGNWGIASRPANETLRSLKSLQEGFAKRGDTENFAKRLQSVNKLSPKFSYAIAEPVSKIPGLGQTLKGFADLQTIETLTGTNLSPEATKKTLKIAPQLVEYIKKGASPLAIAYELEKKNYDSQAFLQYLTDNRNRLKLTEDQGRQIDTPNPLTGTFNDWWLSSFSGLE